MMKPSLQVRLSQHLALTPQLQQSIRLLQLSTLELQQEIDQMLEQNPFLEPEEEVASSFEANAPAPERPSSAAEREDADAGPDTSMGDDSPGVDSAEFGTTEREDWENGTERDDFDGIRESPGPRGDIDDDFDAHDRSSSPTSLQDHLRAQLLGMRLSPEDMAALMRRDAARWAAVVKRQGIKAQ